MEYQTITYDFSDRIAKITFDDPTTLNACSLDTASEILDALNHAQHHARAIILTGAGRAFCSGANLSGDIDDMLNTESRDLGAGLESHYNPMIAALSTCKIPIVTAVNGAAAGIGCSIALMGDLVVASKDAYFLLAFRNIGLVPDGGVTWVLPRLIGRKRAMEMALLGERVYAEQAHDWGLINKTVAAADLEAEALGLAQRLAMGPSVALGLTRQLINNAEDASFKDSLTAERHAQHHAGQTEDFSEGVKAFLEKRPAKFTGN